MHSLAKQIAQQTAQRAAFLVDQAVQEKQSIIIRAQGEAHSAQLIGDAVKANKGFLQLRKLEAAVRPFPSFGPLPSEMRISGFESETDFFYVSNPFSHLFFFLDPFLLHSSNRPWVGV